MKTVNMSMPRSLAPKSYRLFLNGITYNAAGNLTVDAENKRFVYDAENHQTRLLNGDGARFSSIGNPVMFYDNRYPNHSSGVEPVYLFRRTDKLGRD